MAPDERPRGGSTARRTTPRGQRVDPPGLDLLHLNDSGPETCHYLLEAYQNETWKAPGQGSGSGSSSAGYP
jgi:hypothetical protein